MPRNAVDDVTDRLGELFNLEMLYKVVPAAILLAPLLVALHWVMGLAGESMGLSLLLAAVLLSVGYALHPGHEKLAQDLVTILVVSGVALMLAPYLGAVHPVLAVSLSISGASALVTLAGAYSALGLSARYVM